MPSLDDRPVTLRTLIQWIGAALGGATILTSCVWSLAVMSSRVGTLERDNATQDRDIARNAARVETLATDMNQIDKKLGVISYQLEQLGARPPAGK